MIRLFCLALLAISALSASAMAAPQPQRVRGTVASIDSGRLVVHSAAGADVAMTIGSETKYAAVVKADLSMVEPGSYIGTATKETAAGLVALEVVVFPPSMRGAGEGHYAWDKLLDTTRPGTDSVASRMTNGTIESASAASTEPVASQMTNGTVAAAANASEAKQIKVSYKGGAQTIVLPPSAPIVTLRPAEMAAVKPGDAVFVAATAEGGEVTARFVAFGTDGVPPPM